jgi:hypothetical protein
MFSSKRKLRAPNSDGKQHPQRGKLQQGKLLWLRLSAVSVDDAGGSANKVQSVVCAVKMYAEGRAAEVSECAIEHPERRLHGKVQGHVGRKADGGWQTEGRGITDNGNSARDEHNGIGIKKESGFPLGNFVGNDARCKVRQRVCQSKAHWGAAEGSDGVVGICCEQKECKKIGCAAERKLQLFKSKEINNATSSNRTPLGSSTFQDHAGG